MEELKENLTVVGVSVGLILLVLLFPQVFLGILFFLYVMLGWVWEYFIVALYAAIPASLAVGVLHLLRVRSLKARSLAIACCALPIFFLHTWMTIALIPVKEEFTEACKGPSQEVFLDETLDGGHRLIGLDYGGALDRIVEKRNQILREHGCICLPGWYATDLFPTKSGYLYVGPFARR